MLCKKCSSPGTVLLRIKDCYCHNCFITNINHKFRACIGKNKIISKNETVLVCLSGALGSTVLLDLIHNGVSMESHKKLRIVPVFLHLIGAGMESQAENVINNCKKYNFDVYLIHVSQYMEPHLQLSVVNTIPPVDKIQQEKFCLLLKSLPPTTSNDLMLKIQRNVFIKCAKELECKFIFTGETTTTLATTLLTNLALGRGSQVEHDVGFCDARHETVKIIKPMKEISHEELQYYANLKQLLYVQDIQQKHIGLQSVIGAFVTDLQDNFPATISTICKTADKIGIHDETCSEKKCVICESDLGTEDLKLTALEATKFSRNVSYERPNSINFPNNIVNMEDLQTNICSLFPHIHKKLCYSCSRNYFEIDKLNIPIHTQTLLEN